MSFDEACYKDMVRKDPFAAFLFALKADRNQREAFRRWWREAMGLKKEKAGTAPGGTNKSMGGIHHE